LEHPQSIACGLTKTPVANSFLSIARQTISIHVEEFQTCHGAKTFGQFAMEIIDCQMQCFQGRKVDSIAILWQHAL
jgi:hypothetical protein